MNHFGSHFWQTTTRVLISAILCLANCYVKGGLTGDVYCSNGCGGANCTRQTIECDGCTVFGDLIFSYDLILLLQIALYFLQSVCYSDAVGRPSIACPELYAPWWPMYPCAVFIPH